MSGRDDEDSSNLLVMMLRLLSKGAKMSPFHSPLGSHNDPIFWAVHTNFDKSWHFQVPDPTTLPAWHASSCSSTTVSPPLASPFGSQRLANGFDSTWGKVGKIKGWSFDDPLEPMDDAYGTYRKPAGTYFTNRELVKLFDPTLPELPYLYDDFAYAHCSASASG